MWHFDMFVTLKVFKLIGHSNDGRRHGRGTYLLLLFPLLSLWTKIGGKFFVCNINLINELLPATVMHSSWAATAMHICLSIPVFQEVPCSKGRGIIFLMSWSSTWINCLSVRPSAWRSFPWWRQDNQIARGATLRRNLVTQHLSTLSILLRGTKSTYPRTARVKKESAPITQEGQFLPTLLQWLHCPAIAHNYWTSSPFWPNFWIQFQRHILSNSTFCFKLEISFFFKSYRPKVIKFTTCDCTAL
jgi:hypothetical protein